MPEPATPYHPTAPVVWPTNFNIIHCLQELALILTFSPQAAGGVSLLINSRS